MSVENRCPKCRDVALVRPSDRATRLLRCPNCRGTWLPSDEARFDAVSALMEADDSMLPSGEPDLKTGLCPLGHGILIRAKVDLEEPFYLDRCGECCGIWFDVGEWNKLARGHLLANLSDLWNPAVRWRVHKERAEVAYHARLRSELGEATFAQLALIAESLRAAPDAVKLSAVAYLREAIEN